MEPAQEKEMMEPENDEKPTGPDEPELTLPKWIRPYPDAKRRGKLLYIDEWARKRKYQNVGEYWTGVVQLISGFAIFLVSIFTLDPYNFAIGSMALIIFMLFGFTEDYRIQTTMMPFTIYEHGMTLNLVPIEAGWKRQEIFVPWEEIESVDLFQSNSKRSIRIFTQRDENEPLIILPTSDPLRIMELLDEHIPAIVDGLFDPYIGPIDEGSWIPDPLPDRFRNYMWLKWYITVNLFLLFAGIWFFACITAADPIPFCPVALISFVPCAMILYLAVFPYDDEAQTLLMRKRAFPSDDGLHLPRTPFSAWIKGFRKLIPWSEIYKVTYALDPEYLFHDCEVVTCRGDRLRVPFSVYTWVGTHPDFGKEHGMYLNAHHFGLATPLRKFRTSGYMIIVMMILLPFLVPTMIKYSGIPLSFQVFTIVCSFCFISLTALMLFFTNRDAEVLS